MTSLGIGSYAFAGMAGLLSTLSPCVLPLIPILAASAITAHRHGAWALAGGLTISFTSVGILLATAGLALGLDGTAVHSFGAALLLLFGSLLTSTALQARFAMATAGIGNAGMNVLNRLNPQGLMGQLTIGLLLGVVWSPCVGPTLGAASVLAAQGRHLVQAALLMLVFGLGASIPLIIVGSLSGKTISRIRSRLMNVGSMGKFVLGAMLILMGVSMLTGWDKSLEVLLVNHSPNWLTQLTTRF